MFNAVVEAYFLKMILTNVHYLQQGPESCHKTAGWWTQQNVANQRFALSLLTVKQIVLSPVPVTGNGSQ